ncbi:MAG: restriction endonuclease subunit S [Clostridia bacterium]|nr:restriction endonuclease subunit S [Clostridia bacterium]
MKNKLKSFFRKRAKINGSFFLAWEQRKFIDLLDFERPDNYMVSDDHYENDGVPVLTANKAFVLGYKNELGAYNKGNCVIFDDFTLDSKFVDFPFKINSSAIKILTAKHNNNLKFIYYLLSSSNILMQGHARHYISIVQPFVTSVPKTQEQNKIECMISDLDNLITLHQRE